MTIHITPLNDLKEHEETTTCDCEPNVIFSNDEMIVVHMAFDGRQAVEWVNELSKTQPPKQ